MTAVVLTLGEATLPRALRSLDRQTVPVADVVLVRDLRPFHKALNYGASRVLTPYFLQLDSDMVLDPECVELLRAGMTEEVGIAVGPLRDPLMGTIAGIKLFRRGCFEQVQLRDSISQDIDFYHDLAELGWLTLYVTNGRRVGLASPHTLGAHRPSYSPSYTYATYYQLGSRYRRRRDLAPLCWRIDSLRRSAHAAATVARVGLGHGVFCKQVRDVPKRPPDAWELAFIEDLERARREAAAPAGAELATAVLAEPAENLVERGRTLRRARDFAGFLACLRALATTDARRSWLAEASLVYGALDADDGAG